MTFPAPMTDHPEISSTPQHNPPVPGPPFVWWCAVCRREEPFTQADLARFARDGWPVCCGQQVYCYAPPQW
jgi:hypothetical protein